MESCIAISSASLYRGHHSSIAFDGGLVRRSILKRIGISPSVNGRSYLWGKFGLKWFSCHSPMIYRVTPAMHIACRTGTCRPEKSWIVREQNSPEAPLKPRCSTRRDTFAAKKSHIRSQLKHLRTSKGKCSDVVRSVTDLRGQPNPR